ncbi:hypothetical protein P4E94_00065 [Pontiellaceae bacterium B12219]|nr:hypothetical protein [Pontiellaceae bacterium B12219]
MKHLLLQFLILLLATSSFAKNTSDLVTDPAGLKILNKNCIRLGTSEILPINFETACTVLSRKDLVQSVQREFVRSISDDGEVEFPIIGTGPDSWYYLNEDGKRTDITELYRKQTDEFSFDYIVMASGKRFFGRYTVVIHLQVVDAGPGGIIYSVNVHIYPHNWLTRTSQKIGLTSGFFKKKMKMISWVAREIATGLCEQEEARKNLAEGFASPAGTK